MSKELTIKYCKCGCGGVIEWKSHYKNRGFAKYIRGHNPITISLRNKIQEAFEHRKLYQPLLKCYKCKKKITVGSKSGLCKSCSTKLRPKKWRLKLSKAQKRVKKKKRWFCISCNKEISYRAKRCNKCSGIKKRVSHYCPDCGVKIHYQSKRCRKCARVKNWEDVKYRSLILKRRKKSFYEDRISNLIRDNSLNFKFVGNGEIWFGHRNPDFINTNGKKKLIEVYGSFQKKRNYGSIEKYENNRTKHYKKYGFKVMFLNEKQILNKDWKSKCLEVISN